MFPSERNPAIASLAAPSDRTILLKAAEKMVNEAPIVTMDKYIRVKPLVLALEPIICKIVSIPGKKTTIINKPDRIAAYYR